jgi:flagellar hook-basal body complex protein FliE
VKTAVIDTSGIDAMVAQLKVASAQAKGAIGGVTADKPVVTSNFSDVLKASLEQLEESQQRAQKLGQSFALGDEKTDLSEVMIAVQKANIALHAAVQVRNRLVSAYHDIMNMQV